MPTDIHDFKNAASTASVIVIKQGSSKPYEILLIQRKHEPFMGMWALPGGFLNCDQETLEQAAIRELYEETNLVAKESDVVLICVQSDPTRDPRGHVIDHVFAVFKYSGEIEAKDDAANIKFFDINQLPEIAFDHKEAITQEFFMHIGIE
ncbi:MAG: NUDIX hydrolase [Candidatus Nanoarchaeia archaeon]|nr:NUDIX hydrolase [Candidatus Nanoarchaeia archaeon]